MNFYRILIIVGFVSSISLNVLGTDTKEMLFTSQIIYEPIIDLALSKNTQPLNRRQPTRIPEFKITMTVSEFVPEGEDKAQFDNFVQISFNEIKNVKFLIFKKNNLVKKIHVVHGENSPKTIVKYERNIDSLFTKLSLQNKEYFERTKETVISILKREDFLTDLPLGEHVLTFKLEVLTGIAIGDVYFSKCPYRHTFCFRKYYINVSLWTIKPKKILFAVTYLKDYINLASIFDNNKSSGFECEFYPDQGLKRYLLMKNKQPSGVTLWNKGGKNRKEVPFKEWFKQFQSSK